MKTSSIEPVTREYVRNGVVYKATLKAYTDGFRWELSQEMDGYVGKRQTIVSREAFKSLPIALAALSNHKIDWATSGAIEGRRN